MAELANRLGLGVGVAGQAEESARAAVDVLGQGVRYPHWLVVIDSAGESGDVHGLLSAAACAGGGHVLVTSRDAGWSRLAGAMEVDVLPRGHAVALLRARAPRLSESEAGQIAEAVGYRAKAYVPQPVVIKIQRPPNRLRRRLTSVT